MAPAGLTDVVMTVWVTGLHARTFLVGTPNLRLGTDLRLLVYPQVWPVQDVGASEAQPWAFCGGIPLKDLKAKCPKVQPALLRHAWDSSESATAYNILEQLDRVWPVRSGVGGIDLTGSATHSLGTPGLRYYFAPIDDSCPPFPVNPTNGLRTLACTSDLRVDAQLMVESMNARSAAADAADGRHRDRLDHSFVLTATAPGATGGQCTMGGLYGNGSEIDTDPDGGGSYVAAQELTHCVGKMLDATSPHSDGPDTTHSKNNSIAHPSDQPGVNMLTHADVADPQSVMPKSSGARASQIFMEGWDFDYFRGIINALYRTDTAPSNYRLVAATSNHHLTVSLNISGDAASLRWAGAEDGALRNTPPIPTGAYAVVLKDASGTELSRLPFDIPPVALHPGPETTSIGLIADLPGTTAQLDVVHGATTMLSQRFSGAPAIGGVNASINSDGSGADISWQNGAPGTLYSVWYSEHAGSAPIPVAYGLRDAAAHLGLALTAPTDSAVFTVRASDGLHVTSVNAKPLVIPARPPLVAITSPSAGITLTDIEPVTLHAIAFDAAQGPLPDSEVAWTVDGAALGSGVTQITQLTAGDHAAVVTATTTSGATSARATLHVTHKAMPSLVPAPPQAEVRDLGSCPSLAQASVSLPGGTNASSDAGWLKISSAKGGSARLDIDCRMVPSGATLTAPIVFAAASGTVQVLWVQAHGGGIAVPVWLKVVLAILLIAIVTASVGILTLRRIGTVRPTS